MKLICNFKQLKNERTKISQKIAALIAREIYTVQEYYGEMPDDPFKSEVDGSANIILETKEDWKALATQYKLTLDCPEFVRVYKNSQSSDVIYLLGFLSNNEFLVNIFVTEYTLTKFFEDEDKSFIRRLEKQNAVDSKEDVEEDLKEGYRYLDRYYSEHEPYRKYRR